VWPAYPDPNNINHPTTMSKAEEPPVVLAWTGESAVSGDRTGQLAVDFEHTNESVPWGVDPEEPPPPFTPYEAKHRRGSGGDIISHDPHLNEDGEYHHYPPSQHKYSLRSLTSSNPSDQRTQSGEALYRFLLSQAQTPPVFLVHCIGTHSESRTRTTTSANGTTTTQSYTETVTDFSFYIAQRVLPQGAQWTVGDDEPVYRGRMVRETGLPDSVSGSGNKSGGSKKEAESAQVKRFKAWSEERITRGLPPWVGPSDAASREPGYKADAVMQPRVTDVLRSSWTLRQWADNYCASRAKLKEFVYEKVQFLSLAGRPADRPTD